MRAVFMGWANDSRIARRSNCASYGVRCFRRGRCHCSAHYNFPLSGCPTVPTPPDRREESRSERPTLRLFESGTGQPAYDLGWYAVSHCNFQEEPPPQETSERG